MPASNSSRQAPSSLPSNASLNRGGSVRSNTRPPPPPISTVITSPPWARDEPPSPKDQTSFIDSNNHATDSRPSDVASYLSDSEDPNSRWWTFTLPRTSRVQPMNLMGSPSRTERKGFKDRSMSWLPTAATMREGATFARREREKDHEKDLDTASPTTGINREWDTSIPLPTPVAAPFTFAHSATPGWESPWAPRTAGRQPHARENSYGLGEEGLEEADDVHKHLSVWKRRRKLIRTFILNNTYVPLLFRFFNITFTTAALGMAIRIRQLELKNNAMGAVGSSPTVVIIFAPLTLVHVMAAIYLEYFGRPLGLWRTSAKLAHTLSEVLFICAWSAALSLCFDNFFTSLVPCASPSSTSWYNELPRPSNGLPTFEGGIGDRICDDQLALICIVGVGLLIYCTNLVISLFRIFEKVKYHPAAQPPIRTS